MFEFRSFWEIIQLIIGITLIISIKLIVIKLIYNHIRISKLTGDELKFDEIKSIYQKLKKGASLNTNEINKNTQNIKKRILVYDVLYQFNKTNVFPNDFFTIEKSSESYLANWLNMNDDFDCFPDEIVYNKAIELEDKLTVLIFKFKNYSTTNWKFGYVGYKYSESIPYTKPFFIISDFTNEILSKNNLLKHVQNIL